MDCLVKGGERKNHRVYPFVVTLILIVLVRDFRTKEGNPRDTDVITVHSPPGPLELLGCSPPKFWLLREVIQGPNLQCWLRYFYSTLPVWGLVI